MIVIPKRDFPKDLNSLGLKRGDVVQIEVADATVDFITLDPLTLKLTVLRDPTEPREPIVKEPKPKKDTMATMPLPDLKTMIQTTPTPPPSASPTGVGSVRG